MELKRRVFETFCLQVTYDKPNRRIQIAATITEAIAQALENERDLPQEVFSIAQRDIGGPDMSVGATRGLPRNTCWRAKAASACRALR